MNLIKFVIYAINFINNERNEKFFIIKDLLLILNLIQNFQENISKQK